MALNIWDLEDAPKPTTNTSFANDIVGHFKGGYQENGRPVASETIVATTDDPTVAERLAELLGGDIEELDVDRGDDHRIVTESTSVEMIVDGPDALSSRFALYGQAGLVFATDGTKITEGEGFTGEGVGEDWQGRPSTLELWKKQANAGRAPKPDIRLRGRMAADPDLGQFVYRTSGWSLVRDLPALEEQLAKASEAAEGGPVSVTLTFERVTIKRGQYAGREYTRPRITVNGPVNN